jgi:hypothetical protein
LALEEEWTEYYLDLKPVLWLVLPCCHFVQQPLNGWIVILSWISFCDDKSVWICEVTIIRSTSHHCIVKWSHDCVGFSVMGRNRILLFERTWDYRPMLCTTSLSWIKGDDEFCFHELWIYCEVVDGQVLEDN